MVKARGDAASAANGVGLEHEAAAPGGNMSEEQRLRAMSLEDKLLVV